MRAALLGIGLLLAPAVWAQAPAAAPVDAAAADPVRVEAWLESQGKRLGERPSLNLGDPVTLRVQVTAPAGAQVFVPDNPALGPLRRVGKPTKTVVPGPPVVETTTFELVAVRVGPKAVPAIEIPWHAGGEQSGVVTTPKLKLRLKGRLGNEQDPKLAGAPGPEPVITTNHLLIWSVSLAGIALVAVVITLLVMRLLRDRLQALVPPPPPRPANEVALERLAQLRDQTMEPDVRFEGVVNVMREYLGARFGFDGMEMTTQELRGALVGVDLGAVMPAQVHLLLDDADMLKFARSSVDDTTARERLGFVGELVEATWVPPEEDTSAEEQEEEQRDLFEPASAADRLRAATLDALIALGGAAALTGGLFAADLGAWSLLGLILAPAVLGLRDLAGTASPGKRLMGLRVACLERLHQDASVGSRFMRNLPLWVLPVGGPVELLVLLQHPLHRRVGDAWGETVVVRPKAHAGAGKGGPA